MNEQSQMMNQAKTMKHKQPIHHQVTSQPPMQMMMNQLPPPQMMSQPIPMPMMNRSYGMWPQPPPMTNPAMDPSMFQNPYSGGKPSGLARNNNWQGKKKLGMMAGQKGLIVRRNEKYQQQAPHNVNNLGNQNQQHLPNVGGIGYQPPNLLELQSQNRTKARKYYNPKKKFNNRFAPYAPRNTSSFIIRAKKSGGIASLVSPSPVTPAVLPTPVFSPSTEVLGDIAKEEWGVDGYGSMNGLIRLRSPGNGLEDEDDDGSSESESDVEEHVEVERRLDHDLSRFEMIYPNGPNGDYNNLLENRVEDQDTHIAHLEEENLTLKERLFLMEREMRDMRRRLQSLERLVMLSGDATEEVLENGSDNDAGSSGRGQDRQLVGVGVNEELEYVAERRKADDQSYQMEENANVVPQAVLVSLDGLNSDDNVEVSGEAVEEKLKVDVNMDESETVPEQDIDEVEMSGSPDANHKIMCQEDRGTSHC